MATLAGAPAASCLRLRRGARIVAMLVATSFAVAACGGGGSGVTGVDSVGTSTSTAKSSAAKSARASLLAYAQCMRAHGIKDFPEPSGEGFALNGGPGSDQNPNNPQYKAANSACKSLLPVHTVTPAQQAKMQENALKLAKCMRSHGVPNFPDPKFSDSGGVTQESSGAGGIDPNSPQFKAAQKACQDAPPVSSSGGGSSQSGGEESGGGRE